MASEIVAREGGYRKRLVRFSDGSHGEAVVAFDADGDAAAGARTSVGYQQIIAADLATSKALIVPPTATIAEVQNNGNQPVRWRPDGTPPTATVGQRIDAGEGHVFQIGNAGLVALRFIREAEGAVLDVVYYA